MPFQSGVSGNIHGRPVGSQNKRVQLAKLLEPYAEELVAKTVELARAGDVNALRLCLERLIPKATNDSVTFDFDVSEVNRIEYLVEFGKKILTGVVNGDISLSDAKTLSVLADTHRRLIEHGEIKLQLEEIQRARKMGGR